MGGDMDARDAMNAVDDLENKFEQLSKRLEDAIILQDEMSRNLANLEIYLKRRLDKLEETVDLLQID